MHRSITYSDMQFLFFIYNTWKIRRLFCGVRVSATIALSILSRDLNRIFFKFQFWLTSQKLKKKKGGHPKHKNCEIYDYPENRSRGQYWLSNWIFPCFLCIVKMKRKFIKFERKQRNIMASGTGKKSKTIGTLKYFIIISPCQHDTRLPKS